MAEFNAMSKFVDRWFCNPDGTFKSAFYNFEKTAQFEDRVARIERTGASRPNVDQWIGEENDNPMKGLNLGLR